MQDKFVSILTLYFYTRDINFTNSLHLVFLIPEYHKHLLNEIASIVKASNIQNQYKIQEFITKFKPDYGMSRMERIYNDDREYLIEEKIENIISLDIAILEFISSVPERIEQNSFQLPRNADIPYLIGEYMGLKEKQIVSKISYAYELIHNKNYNTSFQKIDIIQDVTFNNNKYLTRVEEEKVKDLTEAEEHDYYLLIDFLNHFFENSQNRNYRTMNSSNLPTYLSYVVEVRQILYAMASTFAIDNSVHRELSNYFYKENPELDQNEMFEGLKRKYLSHMTLRESIKYSNKIMTLLVSFMLIEESNDVNNIIDEMPKNILEYRNQFILILNRMIEQYIAYTLFKVSTGGYIIKYSTLPLIDVPSFDAAKRPISHLIYILQYALNFIPFLSGTL